MSIELTILISVISVSAAVFFGLATKRRNDRADAQKDASTLTTIIVKLESIGKDLSELKSDIRDVKDDIRNHGERIIAVEQQIKVLNNAVFGRKE